ncbi:MAG: hypothetical protein ACOCV9_08120 [Marinilabiliaceae bacterium]
MKEKQKEKLQKIIESGRIHIARINDAYESVSELRPLNRERFIEMTSEKRAFIDQYIFRFAKLQDLIGQKLFRETLETLGEDTSQMAFIDVFRRLEKLNVISDLEEWQVLREIRNDLAHEYPLLLQETIDSVNAVLSKKETLIDFFERINDYLQKKGML